MSVVHDSTQKQVMNHLFIDKWDVSMQFGQFSLTPVKKEKQVPLFISYVSSFQFKLNKRCKLGCNRRVIMNYRQLEEIDTGPWLNIDAIYTAASDLG